MEWITTRRPREWDGDFVGGVWVKCHPDIDAGTYLHWSIVPAGMAWRRHPAADHGPAEPAEPTPGPRLFAAPPVRTWAPEGGACKIDALATDGTTWYRIGGDPDWVQHPPLPQP